MLHPARTVLLFQGIMQEQLRELPHDIMGGGATTNNSGYLTKYIEGLRKFDGRKPSNFHDWHTKLAVVLGVTRRDLASMIKGRRNCNAATERGIGARWAHAGDNNEGAFSRLAASRATEGRTIIYTSAPVPTGHRTQHREKQRPSFKMHGKKAELSDCAGYRAGLLDGPLSSVTYPMASCH